MEEDKEFRKLAEWLKKNYPKIWEEYLETLPSATDLTS